MFRITSQLTLCGEKIIDEEILEKTFFTFHASNMLLQQQYHERRFKKYCDLISCLLVAEQNNELLMKKHEIRSTGTAPFLEANAATYDDQNGNRGRGQGHGRGYGRGRGRGRGRGSARRGYPSVQFNNPKSRAHEKKNTYEKKEKSTSNTCNCCGMENHWAPTCRTTKHLVELYHKSLNNEGKGAEVNFTYEHKDIDRPDGAEDHNNTTHLDVGDFLINE